MYSFIFLIITPYAEYILEGDNKAMGPNERYTYSFDGIYHPKFENKMHGTIDSNVIANLYHDFQKISEHIEYLGKELKDVVKETKAVKSKITIELDSVNSGQQDTMFWIWIVIFVMVLLVVPLYLYVIVRSGIEQQNKGNHSQDFNMEKSIAVVSFSKANAQLHKTIAETVIGEITHHYISLSGVRNVSSVELASKVCFVFVDQNERNIILETKVDISKTRSDFVENLVRQGRTHVIVIYCQHEESRDLDTLFHRGLGNINEHETLRQLQRQNCFLSIDKEFSFYQMTYIKIFLHETLYQ